MLTILESGVQYPEISARVLDHHKGEIFAWITDSVEVTLDDDDEAVINIPAYDQSHLDEGYRRIREYCYRHNTDTLYIRWQSGDATEDEFRKAKATIKNEWRTPKAKRQSKLEGPKGNHPGRRP